METTKLNLFELEIFRAVERPEVAKEFLAGHISTLAGHNISGLRSADDDWLSNPSVFLMALRSGQELVAGSRIHLHRSGVLFPYEKVLLDRVDNAPALISNSKKDYNGEWCGLWANSKFKGIGIRDFLTRVALVTAHSLGLDYIYGICPRHTLDPFRRIGFHFYSDGFESIEINYPTPEFRSFVIRCEVNEMRHTFKAERSIVDEWLASPHQRFTATGKLGECVVQLNGFPKRMESLLIKEKTVTPIAPMHLKVEKGREERKAI